jgi:hypothetical protein
MRLTKPRNLFTYVFTPHTITGCWLSSSSTTAPLQLHSLYRTTITQLELEHLLVFNPTRIAALISSWYQATDHQMPIVCALSGPLVDEQIIPLPTAHPTSNQLPITHTPHLQWRYTYLYSYDVAHYFYICGITTPLLFQYQLLGITAQLPLQSITSCGIALLRAYRLLFGTAFRPAQLAIAFMQRKHHIEQLFSRDDLARLLHIPSSISIIPSDVIPLITCCGLFAERYYESS